MEDIINNIELDAQKIMQRALKRSRIKTRNGDTFELGDRNLFGQELLSMTRAVINEVTREIASRVKEQEQNQQQETKEPVVEQHTEKVEKTDVEFDEGFENKVLQIMKQNSEVYGQILNEIIKINKLMEERYSEKSSNLAEDNTSENVEADFESDDYDDSQVVSSDYINDRIDEGREKNQNDSGEYYHGVTDDYLMEKWNKLPSGKGYANSFRVLRELFKTRELKLSKNELSSRLRLSKSSLLDAMKYLGRNMPGVDYRLIETYGTVKYSHVVVDPEVFFST